MATIPNDKEWARLERNAKVEGRSAGEDAADWIFNPATDDLCRRIIAGLDDGDPEVLDSLPWLDLSGQWADGTTTADILDLIGADEYDVTPEEQSELLDAFRDAHDIAVQDHAGTRAHEYLSDEAKATDSEGRQR